MAMNCDAIVSVSMQGRQWKQSNAKINVIPNNFHVSFIHGVMERS